MNDAISLYNFTKKKTSLQPTPGLSFHPVLYTWQSPQHSETNIVRDQTDFILIRDRFRNETPDVKTSPGTDAGSDQNPVVGNLNLRLTKLNKKRATVLHITKVSHLPKRIDVRHGKLETISYIHPRLWKYIEQGWNTLKNTIVRIEK